MNRHTHHSGQMARFVYASWRLTGTRARHAGGWGVLQSVWRSRQQEGNRCLWCFAVTRQMKALLRHGLTFLRWAGNRQGDVHFGLRVTQGRSYFTPDKGDVVIFCNVSLAADKHCLATGMDGMEWNGFFVFVNRI